MCERRAEDVRKDTTVPIQLPALTDEATDAFEFIVKKDFYPVLAALNNIVCPSVNKCSRKAFLVTGTKNIYIYIYISMFFF